MKVVKGLNVISAINLKGFDQMYNFYEITKQKLPKNEIILQGQINKQNLVLEIFTTPNSQIEKDIKLISSTLKLQNQEPYFSMNAEVEWTMNKHFNNSMTTTKYDFLVEGAINKNNVSLFGALTSNLTLPIGTDDVNVVNAGLDLTWVKNRGG
eukprot:Pgem_evm1s5650